MSQWGGGGGDHVDNIPIGYHLKIIKLDEVPSLNKNPWGIGVEHPQKICDIASASQLYIIRLQSVINVFSRVLASFAFSLNIDWEIVDKKGVSISI
jgi:hypothetical protein